MATQVQTIYDQCCKILYEDVGFSAGTGCLTDDQFYKALSDTILDMMDRIGAVKKIVNVTMIAGVAAYDEPNIISALQSVHVSQKYTFRTSGLYVNATNPYWDQLEGQPAQWREDRIPQTVQFIPRPNVTGYQVAVTWPGGYGTISSASSPNDFDVVCDNAVQGYGTVSGAPNGAVYVETQNQGFGIISEMVPSAGNIQMIATVMPYEIEFELSDWIELLPDPFVPYLKYGICSRLFSADSESKNLSQGKWCDMRYKEGLQLIEEVMSEDEVENDMRQKQ